MLHESSRYANQGTGEVDVISTLVIEDNGLVLQGVMENGKLKARPSNATADSIFMGFSFGIVGTGVPTQLPTADVYRSPAASGGVSSFMAANPFLAAPTVVLGTGYGGTVLTKTASPTTPPADDTQYQLGADNRTITVSGNNANKDVFVVGRYSPTTMAARWIYGDKLPGNRAPQNFGRIGTVTNGRIFTDMFDTSVNWAAVADASTTNRLRGGANGLVTITGVGCTIDAKVVHVPTADLPFLGLALSDTVGA